MISFAWRYKTLIWQLLRRDIHSRYRGSALGLLWSLATPILLLLIYTFVFQYIFKARWNDTSGETTSSFAMILFLGLSLHSILSEVVTKSSQLITTNPNFVKKIVFPLEILPWVNLLGALFNFSICLLLLLIVMFFKMGSIPLTALLLPVILLPYLIMLMGIGWILAALGVYVRDIQQVTGTLSTLLLFLSPVFYSVSSLSEDLRILISLNPLTFVVETSRKMFFYDQLPSLDGLLIYTAVALLIACLGFFFFKKVRPGFSDVL
jgi:lipopolysaccharide transport system permease protein